MAKKTVSMPVEERNWRAESDAETLITAIEIERDSARKKLALVKAQKIVQDAEKRAKAARQVAMRVPSKNKPNPKTKTKTKHKPRARGRRTKK